MQTEELKTLITNIAALIENDVEPDVMLYAQFLDNPQFAFTIIDYLNSLAEAWALEGHPLYSACIFSMEICVNQLHSLSEYGNKLAGKTLKQLMDHLAAVIDKNEHRIGFWLPALNAFYESKIPLTTALKNAYFSLASEDETADIDESLHLDSIRELLKELAGLSDFEVAEHLFAQSYEIMPNDFFADLILDLYNLEEGANVALLMLLHPNPEVREVVVNTLAMILPQITLSSCSLTRLQSIMHWYPENYHPQFKAWIKAQRKKGVIFTKDTGKLQLSIKASEVDGGGSQGIFVYVKKQKEHRLCGVLLKYTLGVKDAWITQAISMADVIRYYEEAFDENVTLRKVDLAYFKTMTEHFLALTIEKGAIPSLHLLEMQEFLNLTFKPQKLDLENLFTHFAIQISPFTEETLQQSFKRSQAWPKTKKFVESWFIENAQIDKWVNRCSHFIDGMKICRLEEAVDAVFTHEMEKHREQWAFHFLWTALWARAHPKKQEKLAEDSFYIAYAIHQGRPLKAIPLMQSICRRSIMNSVETMRERGTHLA